MAGECEALLETMRARNEAAARLRRDADPARRAVLAEKLEEWQGAVREGVRELRAAAERGDPEAAALLDVAEPLAGQGEE